MPYALKSSVAKVLSFPGHGSVTYRHAGGLSDKKTGQ